MTGTAGGWFAPMPPWPAGAAWIGGQYCPIEDAKISVLDLGVTRSDAAYDVVHVWRRRFYRLDDHLDRFTPGMARLRVPPGCGRAGGPARGGRVDDLRPRPRRRRQPGPAHRPGHVLLLRRAVCVDLHAA